MPDKKNQHYVPRHYLKAWNTGGKLNVLPLSAGKIFPEDIGSVCSRDYFYGQPPDVENELGDLEGYQARPLNQLRDGDDLTDLSTPYKQLLLSFVTTQRTRTRSTKLDIMDGEELLRDGVRDDLAANRYDDKIEWNTELTDEEKEDTLVDASTLGIHLQLIVQGIFGYIGIADLQGVMLCNLTDHDFIISDAPIVHDNPGYKRQHELVRAGLGNRGLQILCPIDPNRILLLYDRQVYKFDANHKRQVLIRDPDVVDELNLQQFHNAESIVISDFNKESYIHRLHDKIDEVRRREQITVPHELESGKTVEVEKTPRPQVPGISPDLPDCRTMTHLRYVQRRPTSQVQVEQKLVRDVFEKVYGAPDAAVIYSTRVLPELFGI